MPSSQVKAIVAVTAFSFASWHAESFVPVGRSNAGLAALVLETASPKTLPHVSISRSSKARSKLHMTSTAAAVDDPSEGGKDTSKASGGEGTMSALMFNLVKSIVGAGVLSLPAGAWLHYLYCYLLQSM